MNNDISYNIEYSDDERYVKTERMKSLTILEDKVNNYNGMPIKKYSLL
jgi:hypothetical protein